MISSNVASTGEVTRVRFADGSLGSVPAFVPLFRTLLRKKGNKQGRFGGNRKGEQNKPCVFIVIAQPVPLFVKGNNNREQQAGEDRGTERGTDQLSKIFRFHSSPSFW
jgi:hypothetical protein